MAPRNTTITYAAMFFLTALLCISVFGQARRPTWRNLIPLASTADDVAALKDLHLRDDGEYESPDDVLAVHYVRERCVGNGWDISTNIVLDYTVYPRKEIKMKDGGQGYVITADDASYTYYTDRLNGIQYVVDSSGNISHINYLPAASDRSLRCKGFPEYDPVSAQYLPYNVYALKGMKDDVFRAAALRFQIETGYMGYSVVYFKVGTPVKTIDNFLTQLKGYLNDGSGNELAKVQVIYGGYRDQAEVEEFVLPAKYSPPTPSPKYASLY